MWKRFLVITEPACVGFLQQRVNIFDLIEKIDGLHSTEMFGICRWLVTLTKAPVIWDSPDKQDELVNYLRLEGL